MVKRYPCSQCPEAFFDSLSLKKHENKHNGLNQFECQHCKKTFATKTLCNRHVKTLHEKDQTFNCDMCDFKTYHSTSLTTHREQVHQKLRPHKCEMCEDAFYYKRDLEKHVQKLHVQEPIEHSEPSTVTYVIDGTTVMVRTE